MKSERMKNDSLPLMKSERKRLVEGRETLGEIREH